MKNLISNIFKLIFKGWLIIQNCIVYPIKKICKYLNPLWVKYKFYWNKYTHDKYGDFLIKRAVAMVFATITALFILIEVIEFTFDLGYYLTTRKEETIYLSDSVELEDGLWSAKGCPTADCNSENALYFRIKNTWFNNVWNIFHHGQIFFPDGIAAGVPTGQTECHVISYGLRYRIVMVFNYYPQILEVHCKAEK